MLDHLRLAIPVFPVYAKQLGNHYYFNGDLLELGLPCATRYVAKDDNGQIVTGDIYTPYESLPSSYTDMAFKFYHDSMNTMPYVEIKASPLKLLQGHNVYGFDDIALGAVEMLGLLVTAYPSLCKYLDFANTEVLHLDTTYFCKLPHQNMVQPVLDYLANVQAGHRKAKEVKFSNYVTWSADSRYINAKAYGKFLEVQAQMQKIQKQADKGCVRSKELICAMHDVLAFSNAVVRFEARICKTYLTKNGYPSNLWDLINHQRQSPDMLTKLWNVAFEPIFKTLKGVDMLFKNDFEVENLLIEKLRTVTPTGKVSNTKAYNAMSFYRSLRDIGWKETQQRMSKANFHKQVKSLVDAGISRASLQNLHTDKRGKVIPFVQLVEINFNEQLPPNYVTPTSRYSHLSFVA